jgi:hypothetical protein
MSLCVPELLHLMAVMDEMVGGAVILSQMAYNAMAVFMLAATVSLGWYDVPEPLELVFHSMNV